MIARVWEKGTWGGVGQKLQSFSYTRSEPSGDVLYYIGHMIKHYTAYIKTYKEMVGEMAQLVKGVQIPNIYVKKKKKSQV